MGLLQRISQREKIENELYDREWIMYLWPFIHIDRYVKKKYCAGAMCCASSVWCESMLAGWYCSLLWYSNATTTAITQHCICCTRMIQKLLRSVNSLSLSLLSIHVYYTLTRSTQCNSCRHAHRTQIDKSRLQHNSRFVGGFDVDATFDKKGLVYRFVVGVGAATAHLQQ